MIFQSDKGQRRIEFEKGNSEHGMTMTRIVIVNHALIAPDGSGPVRNLDLDTRGFWRSTALMVALILATPIGPWRRVRVAFWSCVTLHGIVMFAAGLAIWNESRFLGLASIPAVCQGFLENLQHALVAQLSVITVPVLIWLMITLAGSEEIVWSEDLPRSVHDGDLRSKRGR